MRFRRILAAIVAMSACGTVRAADGAEPKGLPQTPEFFPMAVWLQDPSNAERYRAIGINTYVGLWKGPTEEQLDALDRAGIRLICGQSERSLRFKDRSTIVGWMHGDEPDNAQSLGRGKGYGPPIPPEKIVADYRRDQGGRSRPPGDAQPRPGRRLGRLVWPRRADQSPGGLSRVPQGLRHRLVRHLPGAATTTRRSPATSGTCRRASIACGAGPRAARTSGAASRRPGSATSSARPTPQQVRTEVWMALIHGAKGIIYFAHQFKPKFIEAGLLADAEMAREVADDQPAGPGAGPGPERPRRRRTAPMAARPMSRCRSTSWSSGMTGEPTCSPSPCATGRRPRPSASPIKGDARVEVLGEDRTIEAAAGTGRTASTAIRCTSIGSRRSARDRGYEEPAKCARGGRRLIARIPMR